MPGHRRAKPHVAGVVALAALLALLVLASTARAAVQIDADRVTVTGPDGSAVVERRPFRLTVRDAAGQPVLREVDDRAPAAAVVAADPLPTGLVDAPEPALYAPLVFTVGAERNVQYPGLFYGGNQLIGMRGGAQFAAADVIGVRSSGDGAELEVATTDPGGRRLVVTLTPEPAGGIRVSARVTPDDGVIAIGDSFASGPGEAFHGFGGRHNAIDQRGQAFYNWIQQENQGAGALQPIPDATAPAGSGGDRYLFPNGPTAAYHVQSLFVSSRPYGFILDRPELSRWRMASDRPDAWRVSVATSRIDYVVAPGDAPRAIRTLTAITGRQRVAPDWLLGPNYDRGYSPTADAEADVRADMEQFRRHNIPITGYRVESAEVIEPERRRRLFADMRAQGVMPLVYFNPYLDPADAEYATRTPGGAPYLFPTGNVPAFGGLLDVTSPEAVRWWQGRIVEMLEQGAEGFMQDFGEAVQVQMQFANGEDGTTMHNRYPVLYHRITREAIERFERDHPGRRIGFYTRSGYSGSPGSIAYDSANFPGDETTDWSRSSGIRSIASDMLNRGIGGAVGFTTDIGGYLDTNSPPTTKELLLRWAQWSALTPLFRVHGSTTQPGHFPWKYDQETVDIFRSTARLHQRALPLIRALWHESVRSGMPIARPLWLQVPDDPDAAVQDQEWMLGPDVLVAPVVEEGARTRSVYFPRGCWRHPETGERHDGPGAVTVEAPLARLPYFFRCGTDPLARAAAAPRLRLRLALRCSRGRVLATVSGADAARVSRVSFEAGGRPVATDRRAPFTRAISRRAFGRKRVWKVRARVRIDDGRDLTLRRSARSCVRRSVARLTG